MMKKKKLYNSFPVSQFCLQGFCITLQFDRNKMVEEFFYRLETIQFYHS